MAKYRLPSGEIITSDELDAKIEDTQTKMDQVNDVIRINVKTAEDGVITCDKKSVELAIASMEGKNAEYTKLWRIRRFYKQAECIEVGLYDFYRLFKDYIISFFEK